MGVNVQTGQITVSTPEATATDLIQYMNKCGGLNNVATVILEISKNLDPNALLRIFISNQDKSIAQRLGYMMKTFGENTHSKKIHEWLKKKPIKYIKLDPKGPFKVAKKNNQWKIIENAVLEPDEV